MLLPQVQYPDRLPCIMQSPHPALQSDGSLLNFSRTFPFGGSHVYLQGRTTLAREEVGIRIPESWLPVPVLPSHLTGTAKLLSVVVG